MRALPLVFVVACGGSHRAAVAPATEREVAIADVPAEHWETVSDQRLVYGERCGVGPFEIILPARDDEWGRRVVMLVHGRKLAVATRVQGYPVYPARFASWTTGFAFRQEEGDHSRCRSAAAATAIAAASATRPATVDPPRATAGNKTPAVETPKRYIWDSTSAELPKLTPYTGPLPAGKPQDGALSWAPKGNPFYYGDEYMIGPSVDDHGKVNIEIRFWFEAPVDLDGVVFQILDQRLVPDLPRELYIPQFEARVAAANARRDAERLPPPACWKCEVEAMNARTNRCNANGNRGDECAVYRDRGGRMPPPVRAERRPPSPGRDVDWIPGYWLWSEDITDFVWIEGTYVVRGPRVAVAPVIAPAPAPVIAPAPSPVAAVVKPPAEPAVADEAPREITIEAPPPERVEVIAPPPATSGALWIGGYWALDGARWRWTAGRWTQPPQANTVYRRPAIQQRGTTRLYVPGRWIRIR